MKQHFKGVIWPHGPIQMQTIGDGVSPVYRYMVVGVLATDTPIDGLEGQAEIFCDGPIENLAAPFVRVRKRKPKMRLGVANQVIQQLDRL